MKGRLTESSVDPTSNESIQLDFKPLLQCIHIHDALDSRSELQRSYQEDRKVSEKIPLVLKLV